MLDATSLDWSGINAACGHGKDPFGVQRMRGGEGTR